MSGTLNFYTVRWHYELSGKKAGQFGEQLSAHIAASANDPATIGAVIAADVRATPAGAALVIDSISNAGPGVANT